MNCPACAAELDEQRIGGVRVQYCKGCKGVLLAKTDVRALRAVAPSAHPALRASAQPPNGRPTKVLRCPSCGKSMLSHAFGGGNARAQSCEGCDRSFFEAGELGRVLEEMRSGIKMSEETRTLLHGHRVLSAWDRVGRAEVAMIAAIGVGLVTFIVLTRRGGTSLPIAGAIALGLYIFHRWRAERLRVAATQQLDELVRDEAARDEAKAQAAAPSGPWAPPGAARKVQSKPTRACPFCAAPLAAGTTHCDACDSDFG